jgi:hypothetical protein
MAAVAATTCAGFGGAEAIARTAAARATRGDAVAISTWRGLGTVGPDGGTQSTLAETTSDAARRRRPEDVLMRDSPNARGPMVMNLQGQGAARVALRRLL